jgi:DNA-binding winged helix-turn-helix (wHTH) protein
MSGSAAPIRYRFGPFLLDPAERLLLRDGISIALTRKAFDTLLYLVCMAAAWCPATS